MVPADAARPAADKIHQLALAAEKNLEQLATELAHAGADPTATKAVGQMAEIMRKIVSQAGKGGTGAPPEQAAPPAPAQPHTMDTAVNDTQAELAARRAQPQ